MFEKDAEEYAGNTYEMCSYSGLPYASDRRAREQAFQKGAEFGYNKAKVEVEDSYRESLCNSELNLASITEQLEELEKANEWHYVKDGELPKGLPKPVLVTFHNKFSDKIVIDIARYSLELNKWWFIHDLKDLEEDVIAWKEIILPEQ